MAAKPRRSRKRGTGTKISPAKKGPGRPEHVPSEANKYRVAAMASVGIPQPTIARKLGIDPTTLRLHYATELDDGKADVIADLSETLVAKGRAGDLGSIAFYLKTQGGWRESRPDDAATVTVDLTIRRDGGEPSVTPVPVAGEPDVSGGGA